jgi:hypothetical protein
MYIGDLNYDFLDEKKCAPLVSICDILDLTNLVKRPTCFTKIADPRSPIYIKLSYFIVILSHVLIKSSLKVLSFIVCGL